MSAVDQLKPFLEPKSVAVIGAQPGSGELAFNTIDNLAYLGYKGQVYPVNPDFGEISGMKSYPSVVDIPGDVDLAIISARRRMVPGIIKQCADKGVKAAIVTGQGFADASDEEGKRLQQQLVEAARRGGVRVLGPNTIGTANAFINFSTSFAKQMNMRKLPVAVISQTGLLFCTFGRLGMIGKGIDLGNACDVDIAEAMEYFEQDPEIKVIVLHIEGIRDSKRFKEVAHRVARKKPVLAFKTGRSQRGAEAAMSHSASLVGRDEVWEAVFKQCGIIRVNDLDEMEDTVRAFCYLPLMRGRRIGIVSASGGFGIISVDACARYNLEVAELSPATVRKLKDKSPSWLKLGNPLDFWALMLTSTDTFGEKLRAILIEVLSDRRVDALVLIAGVWFEGLSPPITKIIEEVTDTFADKPIAWCTYEGWLFDIRADELTEKLEKVGKGAVFFSPDRAIRALARLAEYSEFRSATT